MCLAVPLKLIEIHGNDAVGEAMGMQRKLRVDFIPQPKIGDYVLEDLETWEELDDALR